MTDTYTYDAFGLLLALSGSTENNYLYTGEQYDPNVGFYYLRARYYNPNIGRFLTQDTWPGMQFEPMSLHKYLYCESGPVGKWDFNGKFIFSPMFIPVAMAAILLVSIFTCTISGVGWGFLGDWLSDNKIPVDWTGSIESRGASLQPPYFAGFILIYAHFEGSRNTSKGIETSMGNYTFFIVGISIGFDFVDSSTGVDLISPGILGADPKNLTGGVAWLGASYVNNGGSYGKANFWCGNAYGNTGISEGVDIGLSGMTGISFISGPSYWHKP